MNYSLTIENLENKSKISPYETKRVFRKNVPINRAITFIVETCEREYRIISPHTKFCLEKKNHNPRVKNENVHNRND